MSTIGRLRTSLWEEFPGIIIPDAQGKRSRTDPMIVPHIRVCSRRQQD